MSMIMPVLVVISVGFVAGVILTVAAKLMYVPVDETVAKLTEALPGANCGACGYAGCEDYANAMGEDHSISVGLCPVGGASVANDLAGILGVEAETTAPKAAYVLCSGTYDVTERIMEFDQPLTCKAANQMYGGPWVCSKGCMGLGDCAAVCDYDAITIENGLAKIDQDKCVACGMCVTACPKNIIEILEKRHLVYVACSSNEKGGTVMKQCKSGCIGCKKCEKVCKFDAIHIEDNLARVDYEKCVNCGMCEKVCPTKAIENLRLKNKKKVS